MCMRNSLYSQVFLSWARRIVHQLFHTPVTLISLSQWALVLVWQLPWKQDVSVISEEHIWHQGPVMVEFLQVWILTLFLIYVSIFFFFFKCLHLRAFYSLSTVYTYSPTVQLCAHLHIILYLMMNCYVYICSAYLFISICTSIPSVWNCGS